MYRLIFLLFTVFILSAFKGDDYAKVKVNDDITVFLPPDFSPLSQEEINKRQLSHRKPLLFYTDPYSEVDFTVNMSYSLWGKNDLEILRSFYRSTLMSMYDEVNFIRDDIVEIEGRGYVMFEFESLLRDDEESFVIKGNLKNYTLIIYTILENNNTVLVSFTCPSMRMEAWQETAHKIMSKVKIKK